MSRMSVVLMVTVLAATCALADPALGGGRGLWRLQDARVEEDGALVFSNRWVFNRDAFPDSAIYRGPLFGMELSYAPAPFLEVFGSLVGVFEYKTGPNRIYYDWQGQAFGGKLSFPYLPVLKVAGVANWMMNRSDYQFQEQGFMDNLFSPGKSWRGVGSLRFADLYKTLPTLMVNYGQSLETEGRQMLGAGLEFSSDAIDVFVEGVSEIPKGMSYNAFFGKDYTPVARVSPGVRIRIPYFHITGGVEIGITDSTPDYQAILGFNFVSPFPKPKPKPWGRLAGKVVDARSGMPLNATVSSPNKMFRQRKTDNNGIFFLQRAPTGVIVVEAAADGYISEAVPLVILDQGYATYTFQLKPLVPYGTVAGRTFDRYSGDPIEAEISFIATKVPPAKSNEMTGFFRVDNVPAGLVSVRAEKDGYFPEETVVEVEDGGISKLNIGMSPLDMKGVFEGKVVDKQTGDALAATITFVDQKRKAIATDKGDGTFSTELPVGGYEVKVEADGYLAQPSAFVIEKGQTLTRNYEMVAKGMVLTLRGVYFEFGKAILRTESYPALTEAAQIMKDNPEIAVELRGHTDAIGSDAANQTLSEKRAYAVMNWLVQFGGIDAKRLTARGYGEAQPIASNDTDEGRQLNRRTEFVIQR